jgi:hypothetical protein
LIMQELHTSYGTWSTRGWTESRLDFWSWDDRNDQILGCLEAELGMRRRLKLTLILLWWHTVSVEAIIESKHISTGVPNPCLFLKIKILKRLANRCRNGFDGLCSCWSHFCCSIACE